MTTFHIGDRVRLVRDTPYGAKKGQEFTITYISTPLKPEGAYASGEGFPGGVWLTDLELAEKPAFAIGGYVPNDPGVAIGEQLNLAPTPHSWTGAPQHPGSVCDRHIQRINGLYAAIRRRNETIERQKAQLAEYAAELKPEPLAPQSIRLTIEISDAGGEVKKYGALLGDATEDSALDLAFKLGETAQNTVDYHFAGKPPVAELLNGDAA